VIAWISEVVAAVAGCVAFIALLCSLGYSITGHGLLSCYAFLCAVAGYALWAAADRS
jgi:hypothetical protein